LKLYRRWVNFRVGYSRPVRALSLFVVVLLVSGSACVAATLSVNSGLTIPPGTPAQPPGTVELSSPNAQSGGGFGYSIATNGAEEVVGAPFEAVGGDLQAGSAYVFNATTGTLISTLVDPNSQSGGWFGSSVAVSGGYAVVGAYREAVGKNLEAGRAYVFSALTGKLLATLTSPNLGSQEGGEFGWSVASNGTSVIVGAPDETVGGNAYVFSGTSGFKAATQLTSPFPESQGEFGASVAMSGEYAVVGEPNPLGKGGDAYVFEVGSRAVNVANLTSPNAQQGGSFGYSVAVSGSTAVVGAPYETIGSKASYDLDGRAYVFGIGSSASPLVLGSPNPQYFGFFGISVAVSGSYAVVGAYGEADHAYSQAGRAYAFNAATGALTGLLASPGAVTDGFFGHSVAVSGSVATVGAYGESPQVQQAGSVYAFGPTIASPNGVQYGWFGYSVATYGNTTVVGAYGEEVDSNAQAGRVYVFNSVTGALVSTLTSPFPQTDGWFGYSVATNGTSVLVGAYGETDDGNASAGNAYIFNAATGALATIPVEPHSEADGWYGYSVAMSGDDALVGAPGENSGSVPHAGNAYLFAERGIASTRKVLTSPNAVQRGWFGASVAISGKTAVVGAYGETSEEVPDAGNVYVFSTATGGVDSTLASPSLTVGGWFGYSVAVDGTTVVVGAPSEPVQGIQQAGNAYVFSATTGARISTLTSPNPQLSGEFGYSVAVSANAALVGAPFETAGRYSQAGNAYVFNATNGGIEATTLTAPSPQYDERFGLAVAISGTATVEGAPYASQVTGRRYSQAGYAYIFNTFWKEYQTTLRCTSTSCAAIVPGLPVPRGWVYWLTSNGFRVSSPKCSLVHGSCSVRFSPPTSPATVTACYQDSCVGLVVP